MLRALAAHEIGGGQVMQTFTIGSRRVYAGEKLSAAELGAMPAANRNALIEKNRIFVWPKSVAEASAATDLRLSSATDQAQAAPATPSSRAAGAPLPGDRQTMARHVIPLGFGRYDVVEGARVNEAPILSRDEAYGLAGLPVPEGRAPKSIDAKPARKSSA